MRLYPLSLLLRWPTLSFSIRLDPLPLSFVEVRVRPDGFLSLLFCTQTRDLFEAPAAVSTHFFVAT